MRLSSHTGSGTVFTGNLSLVLPQVCGGQRQRHLLGFPNRTVNAVLMSPGFVVAQTWPPSLVLTSQKKNIEKMRFAVC